MVVTTHRSRQPRSRAVAVSASSSRVPMPDHRVAQAGLVEPLSLSQPRFCRWEALDWVAVERLVQVRQRDHLRVMGTINERGNGVEVVTLGVASAGIAEAPDVCNL